MDSATTTRSSQAIRHRARRLPAQGLSRHLYHAVFRLLRRLVI